MHVTASRPIPRLARRPIFLLVTIMVVIYTGGVIVPVPAQSRGSDHGRSVAQPVVVLVLGEESATDNAVTREARELLETTIEGHLRSSLRYVLTRVRTDLPPEQYEPGTDADAVIFARAVPRRDGSLRVELDIRRDDQFIWSLESQLPLGRERFRIATVLAETLEEELARSFPAGFGRLAFRNGGVDQPWYVFIDGALLGVNVPAVELFTGSYVVEVRRRDEGFEHVVGYREVTLLEDDYLELGFRLERNPPPVPGFMRLTNPEDRWNTLFDLRGVVLIPQQGFGNLEGVAYGSFGTVLFNHVLFTGHVFGFDAGYTSFQPGNLEDDTELTMEITSLLATTGVSVGPVSKVDYIVRVGGGVALTRSKIRFDPDNAASARFTETGYSPAFAGSMEFGFGFGRALRMSLNISYQGVHEEDELYSFIGLGVGLGGRF